MPRFGRGAAILKPVGRVAAAVCAWPRSVRLGLLIALLACAFSYGIFIRWHAIRNAGMNSPDCVGFVELARMEPYHYLYGWREPLWAFLLRAGSGLTGWDAHTVARGLVLLCSILVVPVLYGVVRRTAGRAEALLAAGLMAVLPGNATVAAFAAREELGLLGVLVLTALLIRRQLALALVLAGALTHLRVGTFHFVALFYPMLLMYRYFSEREQGTRPLQYLRQTHSWRDAAGLLGGVLLAFPVFAYFGRSYGDPFFPQNLAIHEYYYYARHGSWYVDVTHPFDQEYRIDRGLGREIWSEGGLRLALVSVARLSLRVFKDYFATPLAALPFMLCAAACLRLDRGRIYLLFFAAGFLPLLLIGWSPAVRTGLVLIPATAAVMILAVGTVSLVRAALDSWNAAEEKPPERVPSPPFIASVR